MKNTLNSNNRNLSVSQWRFSILEPKPHILYKSHLQWTRYRSKPKPSVIVEFGFQFKLVLSLESKLESNRLSIGSDWFFDPSTPVSIGTETSELLSMPSLEANLKNWISFSKTTTNHEFWNAFAILIIIRRFLENVIELGDLCVEIFNPFVFFS